MMLIERHRFWRRSMLYARLHDDPRIRSRTNFFAAAATITRVFAWENSSRFMGSLSASLEVVNLARAGEILGGRRYPAHSIEANTADFIEYEQQVVDDELRSLRLRDPVLHGAELAAADAAFCRMTSCPITRRLTAMKSPAHRRLQRALAVVSARLGHTPRFGSAEDRVKIGLALAAQATMPAQSTLPPSSAAPR